LGIGDWGLGPIPNPQSPIPNPQSPIPKKKEKIKNLNLYDFFKFEFIFILPNIIKVKLFIYLSIKKRKFYK
jgi:hypothetical protein